MQTKKPLKMYVLVRNDLDTTYRGVQGIHAVAAFYEGGNFTNWHNECPKCGSKETDSSDDIDYECLSCGYGWSVDRSYNPERCPNCKSLNTIDNGDSRYCHDCNTEYAE